MDVIATAEIIPTSPVPADNNNSLPKSINKSKILDGEATFSARDVEKTVSSAITQANSRHPKTSNGPYVTTKKQVECKPSISNR